MSDLAFNYLDSLLTDCRSLFVTKDENGLVSLWYQGKISCIELFNTHDTDIRYLVWYIRHLNRLNKREDLKK